MKKFFLIFSFSLIFSGCSISDEGNTTEIFIPNEKGNISLSADISAPASALVPELKETLSLGSLTLSKVNEIMSPSGDYSLVLYTDTKEPCIQTNVFCWGETWEYEDGNRKQKLASFDLQSGQEFFWVKDSLIAQKIEIKTLSTKTYHYPINIFTGTLGQVWIKKVWNNIPDGEVNPIITFKIKGISYFLDVLSEDDNLTLYQIIDPVKNFYVQPYGLENLKKIDTIQFSSNQKVSILSNPTGIEFEGEEGGRYFYDPSSKKISPLAQ